ncbi:hypothetical protein LguiB_002629 [Lonicera macranthoides]
MKIRRSAINRSLPYLLRSQALNLDQRSPLNNVHPQDRPPLLINAHFEVHPISPYSRNLHNHLDSSTPGLAVLFHLWLNRVLPTPPILATNTASQVRESTIASDTNCCARWHLVGPKAPAGPAGPCT